MSDNTEYEVQEIEDVSGKIYEEYAYIINNDNGTYSMILLNDRNIMNTEFNNYTVEEGLTLMILILLWVVFMIGFIRWAFKWVKSY